MCIRLELGVKNTAGESPAFTMPRPKAIIDWKRVDYLLQAQCDGVGIAGILGVSPDTLYRACQEENKIGFAEYSQQKKSEGRELLRAKQFEKAINEGDKTMLVWLGKQYLGQKDRNDITTGDKQLGGINIVAPTEADEEIIKRLIDADHTADTKND